MELHKTENGGIILILDGKEAAILKHGTGDCIKVDAGCCVKEEAKQLLDSIGTLLDRNGIDDYAVVFYFKRLQDR